MEIAGTFSDKTDNMITRLSRDAVESLFNLLSLQKYNLLLWLPVILACGIGTYFSLSFEPPFIVAASLSFLLVCLSVVFFSIREQSATHYIGWLCLITITLFTSGFALAQYRTISLGTVMLADKTGPAMIAGRVIDIDRMEGEEGSRVILSDIQIEDIPAHDTPQKVRIRIRKDQDLEIGQNIEVLGALNPPSAPVSPRAFDFQRYAYFQGIGAFGFAYRAPEVTGALEEKSKFLFLESLRQNIIHILDEQMAFPSEGIAAALLTGERTTIPEDVWDNMRDSGMAHMLAISGLHVGMIAGVVFFAVRLAFVLIPGFALRYPAKKYAAVAAMIAAFMYMIIVGSTIPTQRAMLMTAIVMMAVILDRKAISMRLVAITAFAVLILTPDALWSASFQMSFAAVAMLVWFYDAVRSRWSVMHRNASWLRRLMLYVLGVSMTTVIATLATAPFAIYHFQQLSLYSLFANLVGVPVMAFIVMPLTALSYPAMALGIEAPVLWALGRGIDFILDIANHVAHLEGATWNPPAWNFPALVMVVSGVIWFMIVKGQLRRFAVLPFALSVILTLSYTQLDILVSESGHLMAYRDMADGAMYFNSRSTDRFSSDIWARRNGQSNKLKWPFEQNPKDANANDMKCDAFGCHMMLKGVRVAFSKQPQSHRLDCAWADLLVAEDPVFVKPCKAQHVIDKFSLWRNGATSVRISKNGRVFIESVAGLRGNRPWSVSEGR